MTILLLVYEESPGGRYHSVFGPFWDSDQLHKFAMEFLSQHKGTPRERKLIEKWSLNLIEPNSYAEKYFKEKSK